MKRAAFCRLKYGLILILAGFMVLSSSYVVRAEAYEIAPGLMVEEVVPEGTASESGMLPDSTYTDMMPSIDADYEVLNEAALPSAYAPFDVRGLFPELSGHPFTVADFNCVTSVKNQGSYGFCFAFASAAAMEASLVKRYYPTLTADTVDLSELQLAYYTQIRDGRSQPEGCERDLSSLNGFSFNTGFVGANDNFVTTGIARRVGLVNEADAPYGWLPNNIADLEDGFLADSHNAYVLENTYMISGADTDRVKALVRDHGGAACWVNYVSSNLNSDKSSLCQLTQGSSNHEGCIVGWDDDYPRTNFRQMPSQNGAFLVKNSYGKNSNRSGYYWLSYEDAVLSRYYVYAYDLVPEAEAEGAVFQKDGGISGKVTYWSTPDEKITISGAQVFEIHQKTKLTALSYYHDGPAGVKYIFDLYKQGESENPADWIDIATAVASGTFDSAGFKKIPLNDEYYFNAGDRVVVIISLRSDDEAWNAEPQNHVNLTMENALPKEQTLYVSSTYSRANETYLWDGNNIKWIDLNDRTSGNLRLKVYGEILEKDVSGPMILGRNRYETAAVIAAEAFRYEETPDTVIIAKGTTFPDALSANALAGIMNVPLLLTNPDRLSGTVSNLLTNIWQGHVKKVIFVGKGISDTVRDSLRACGVQSFDEIGGANRYRTSEFVYDEIKELQKSQGGSGDQNSAVFMATGLKAADALSVSVISYRYHIPVLLVKPNGMPTQTSEERMMANAHVFVMGGEDVVSEELIDRYKAACGDENEIVRLAGPNRYSTALKAAQYFTSDDFYMYRHRAKLNLYNKVGFAAGNDEYVSDALSSGQLLGKVGGVLLIHNDHKMTGALAEFVKNDYQYNWLPTGTVYRFGRAASPESCTNQLVSDYLFNN